MLLVDFVREQSGIEEAEGGVYDPLVEQSWM